MVGGFNYMELKGLKMTVNVNLHTYKLSNSRLTLSLVKISGREEKICCSQWSVFSNKVLLALGDYSRKGKGEAWDL